MIKVVAVLLFLSLISMAALHAFWAFGGLWPGSTERELIDTVVGDPRLQEMPSQVLTVFVAAMLLTSAVIALFAGGLLTAPGWLAISASMAVGIVFLSRGIVGLFFFEKVFWQSVEPFTTLNLRYYSPLCLALGVGFLILAVSRIIAK
ncbi:MAG: DUF3995 domain-containing protein [Pseudomonadota bacterium]